MNKRLWISVGGGLVAGVIGVLLTVAMLHIYADHQALHAIINMINQNAAKQAQPPH